MNTALSALLGLLICAMAPAHAADQAVARATTVSPIIAGWDEFLEGLRVMPNLVFAKLPPSLQSDPHTQQEVVRLILEALATATLDAVSGDGDYPAFLPFGNQTLKAVQPNADTIYRAARITPDGVYRLRGNRGSLRIAIIGQSPSQLPGPIKAYNDINSLHADANGNFDVVLSPTRPEGYAGDWWELQAATRNLLLRMVSSDWTKERDPTISIERVDKPMGRPRRSAIELAQRLRDLPAYATYIAALQLAHVEDLRQQGYVNKLKMMDTSLTGGLGGLTGQAYYEGTYEIAEDEALVVETKIPTKCLYWSMILTNHVYETTDWQNNLSSLNDTQAKPDKDGILRVVISAKDPGVPNWLDTGGYPHGSIQGRWSNCDERPLPSVRKVTLTDIRKSLPKETGTVTVEQREGEIRARRALLQQRPYW